MTMQIPANAAGVGITWYKRADYKRILEIMVDRENLPPTFDKWQSLAEKAEEMIRRQGRVPLRAHLDPDKFVAWCAERGLDINANARTRFAADQTHWEIGDKH